MPKVDAGLWVVSVDAIHVVAFLVGNHLQRQFIVVSQEHAPLGDLGDLRGLSQDVDDGKATTVDFRHNTVYDHPAWPLVQVRPGMVERGTSLGAHRLLWNPSACQRVGNHHFTLQT